MDIKSENLHLNAQYIISSVKTSAVKNRVIPIHKAIVPLVKKRLSENRQYLITNKYGKHYTHVIYCNSNWNALMERVNMNHSPHDCCYTFANLADTCGMNETCKKIIMDHTLHNKSGTAFKIGGTRDVARDTYTKKPIQQFVGEVNKIIPITF